MNERRLEKKERRAGLRGLWSKTRRRTLFMIVRGGLPLVLLSLFTGGFFTALVDEGYATTSPFLESMMEVLSVSSLVLLFLLLARALTLLYEGFCEARAQYVECQKELVATTSANEGALRFAREDDLSVEDAFDLQRAWRKRYGERKRQGIDEADRHLPEA